MNREEFIEAARQVLICDARLIERFDHPVTFTIASEGIYLVIATVSASHPPKGSIEIFHNGKLAVINSRSVGTTGGDLSLYAQVSCEAGDVISLTEDVKASVTYLGPL